MGDGGSVRMNENKLEKEIETTFRFYFTHNFEFNLNAPDLYHYRSGSSITSIFESENIILRLTAADCFEDKLEGKAVEVYYDIALEEMLRDGQITKKQFEELSQVEIPNRVFIFQKTEDGLDLGKWVEFDAFIICFSTVKDDPYMYKKYVHNKESGGFCIEFSGTELCFISHLSMDNEASIKLIPVMYGGQAVEYIKEQVQEVINDSVLYKRREQVLGEILHQVQFSVKRNRYSRENEIRLIVYMAKNDFEEHPNIFRDVNSNGEKKKEYIKFRIPKNVVFNITPDPNNNPDTTDKAIKHIQAQGYSLIK